MSAIITKSGNNEITVRPEGRIDSVTAVQFGCDLDEAVAAHPGCDLVLDFDKVDYIASAGLRVVLRAAKSCDSFKIVNVAPPVYGVFELTGFHNMLDVRRKLRNIDVEGCEVIGRGAIGTVYRLDPDTIVKVYNIDDAMDMIKNEHNNARKALQAGVPTAISYDIVSVGDKYGLVFELINARTFAELLADDPSRIDELAGMHSDVMRELHAIEVQPGEFPDNREIFAAYVRELGDVIPEELSARLEKLFMSMPENLHMIHGDMQMKNVMLFKDEPLIIDMDTVSTGDPVFEFANLCVGYVIFNEDEPDNSNKFLGLSPETTQYLMDKALDLYTGPVDPETRSLILKKVKIAGYVRFLYLIAVLELGLEEYREARVKHSIEHLEELISEIDVLGMAEM